jgi:hypothetical protein
LPHGDASQGAGIFESAIDPSRRTMHHARVTIGPIHELMQRDHERLAALLDAACRDGLMFPAPFHEFRAGLLRHIGMEEKVLLPAAKELRGGEALPAARQLRLDHAALAALLVPTPTPPIVERVRTLLALHNALEEGDAGVYAQCEQIVGTRREALLAALRDFPPVKLAAYQDGPRGFASIERLWRATGRW